MWSYLYNQIRGNNHHAGITPSPGHGNSDTRMCPEPDRDHRKRVLASTRAAESADTCVVLQGALFPPGETQSPVTTAQTKAATRGGEPHGAV